MKERRIEEGKFFRICFSFCIFDLSRSLLFCLLCILPSFFSLLSFLPHMSVGADRIRQQQQFNQNQQNQNQQSTSATSPLPFFCRVGFASAAGIGAAGSGRDLLPLATCRRFLLCRLTTTTCSDDHGDGNGKGNSQSNHHHHQYSHQHSNGEERNYEAVVGCDDDVDEDEDEVGSFEQEQQQQQQLASELVHLAPRQTAVQSYGSLLRV